MTKNNWGSSKRDIVQVKNPRTDRYVKIDPTAGFIVARKESQGHHKGVPLATAPK